MVKFSFMILIFISHVLDDEGFPMFIGLLCIGEHPRSNKNIFIWSKWAHLERSLKIVKSCTDEKSDQNTKETETNHILSSIF